MKNYTSEEIINQMKSLGYKIPKFHLVGIRSKNSVPDKFDDLFYIFENYGIIDGPFWCTTNPGKHWLNNLLNPRGAALLKPGQYLDAWKVGQHQGKYTALVQAKPVTVYRDKDLDDLAEITDYEETGLFGINIHRANDKLTSILIGKWSAGCQVLASPTDFSRLMSRVGFHSHDHNFYTYTLLDEF